jgi:hypothetical protein
MGVIWWLAGTAGALLVLAAGDLVSEEIRARLDRLPYGLLRLARRRLPAELRETVHDQEWAPELEHILRRAGALPVTRLIAGTRFALGLATRAPRIGAELLPERTPDSSTSPEDHGAGNRWRSALHSIFWPVWEPGWLRVYILALVTAALAATGIAAAFTAIHTVQLEVFLVLIAVGLASEPTIRNNRVAQPLAQNTFGTWGLPVALLLPPLYGLLAPFPYIALFQCTRPVRNIYRRLFTGATMSLTCGGASAVCHLLIPQATAAGLPHLTSRPGLALTAIACWALLRVLHNVLIITAVKGSDPTASISSHRRELLHEIPELTAGTTIAFAISLGQLPAITALLAVLMLQRPLHRRCGCYPAEHQRPDSLTGAAP